MTKALPVPGKTLLTPEDHILIMIDHQSQMAFPTRSIGLTELRNNVALVAQAAKGFNVSTILTSVAEKTFSGPLFDEIKDVFKGERVIDRTTMNAWEDKNVTEAVNQFNKSRLVLCGLWTSVCIADPALSAIEQGFEVYIISDACGDISCESHKIAIQRMIQMGVRPMTSLQYLLELQRDWARGETYNLTTGIARKHGGGYGIGLAYAGAMFGGHEN